MTGSGNNVIDDSEIGFGGYGDVYLATLDGSSKVAVKQLRIIQKKAVRIRVAMRLARELKIWAKANHPNVLKLIGYHLSEKYDCAQLTSPYMENGNIVEYIKRTQASIEARLGFLNVLISDKPDAVLCDFGLALFIADSGGPSGLTTSKGIKVSPRYMGPELLDEEEGKHTLESDIWAWACTIFEIITDLIPYANLRTDRGIAAAIGRGASPGSVELLDIIRECWSTEPGERPSSSSILHRLGYDDLGNPDMRSADTPLDDKQTGDSAITTERIITGLSILSKIQLSGEPDQVEPASPTSGESPAPEIPSLPAPIAPQALIRDLGSTKPQKITIPSIVPDLRNRGDLGNGAVATGLNKAFLFREPRPFAQDLFSDVYLGRWTPHNDPKYPQGVDVLSPTGFLGRTRHVVDPKRYHECARHLERKVPVWQKVDQPRVTPVIGYISSFIDNIQPCIVSPRRLGNLETYIKINPQADRLRLLCQSLEGLVYLHTFSPRPIAHLGIKPKNILVTYEGTAELSDFGLAEILEACSEQAVSPQYGMLWDQYTTPEKLTGAEYGELTPKADIYAIGLVILYVLSGKQPWSNTVSWHLAILRVARGEVPRWADHPMVGSVVEKTRDLLQRCWCMKADERPSAQEVLNELLEIEALGGVGPPNM
ncbi:hypothetical protein FS837_004538 [Tulasnella sp. UAMH 9824]|nr:hypothetical protein FS837_004538 [Tulasnella sp. UAMH 9824]